MNRSEGLDLMANLLESGWEQGWRATQGWPTWNFDDAKPTRRFDYFGVPYGCCIEGADHWAQMLLFPGMPYPPVKFLTDPPEGFEGWSQWNDAPGRIQQQVIDCLRNLAVVERIREAR